jgi:Cu/Ag efflux protein CusF
MSGMTMPFPVDDSTVVEGVKQGDSISFEISVQGNLVAISAIEVIE